VEVRDATQADLPAIVDIYNAWIPTRTITWTETLETLESRAAWFARQQLEGWPVLVADDAGTVAGVTWYEPFRGEGRWPGYRTTAELSIHVRESYWGRGVGRALIEALVERGRAGGIHVLVAGIDAGNSESVRFHERLGFVEVARMPEVGQKFGRWLDLVLMQRIIDERTRPWA
jgi:phosphinothricin acetyltransferase